MVEQVATDSINFNSLKQSTENLDIANSSDIYLLSSGGIDEKIVEISGCNSDIGDDEHHDDNSPENSNEEDCNRTIKLNELMEISPENGENVQHEFSLSRHNNLHVSDSGDSEAAASFLLTEASAGLAESDCEHQHNTESDNSQNNSEFITNQTCSSIAPINQNNSILDSDTAQTQTSTSISSNARIMSDCFVYNRSPSDLSNNLANNEADQLIADSNIDKAPLKVESDSISNLQDSLESTILSEMTHTTGQTSSENQNVITDSKILKSKPFSSIPGPWPSLPFIGTGWQYFYFFGRYDLSKLHMAYIDKYRIYGPILKEEYQWGKSIVHIYDPNDFEIVFRSQGRYPIRPPNEFVSSLRSSQLDKYPSIGLANLNGEEWSEQRHKLAPAIMKLRTINENISCQNEVCDDFIKYLWKVRDPKTNIVSNLQEGTYRLALEAICVMCLDSRVGSFDDEQLNADSNIQQSTNDGSILIEATKLLFDSFNKLYYGLPIWKYFSTNAYSNLERAESSIYEIASKYVEKAMDGLHENCESNHSVLQTLLNTKGLSQKEVKITIIDFISGGIFTVSNTLVYLFHHLAANQKVQQKLYDEIESVLNESQGDQSSDHQQDNCKIGPAHIAKMSYLKACVRECFRLNCPVPGIMRVTSVPLVLSGYHVPANTAVFSHTMATCLIDKYFKDPDRFWPERWIDPVERSRINPFALLPFGFGSRMCVGKRFSETEIYLAAAKLIQAYRIELVPGLEELELTHAFLVIPARPISLRIVPRCQ